MNILGRRTITKNGIMLLIYVFIRCAHTHVPKKVTDYGDNGEEVHIFIVKRANVRAYMSDTHFYDTKMRTEQMCVIIFHILVSCYAH